jgi:hypothetical protein
MRAYGLGQDAFAGNVFTPISGAKNPKFNGVGVKASVTEAQLKQAVDLGAEINPDMVVVHSPGMGIRAWIPGDTSKAAQRQVQRFANELPYGDKATFGRVESQFDTLNWAGGGATEDVLKILDDPEFPGFAARADSPETRAVMGKLAEKYEAIEAANLGIPNKKLVAVLRTWAEKGLPGVREMVRQGLAPAAVVAILASRAGEDDA